MLQAPLIRIKLLHKLKKKFRKRKKSKNSLKNLFVKENKKYHYKTLIQMVQYRLGVINLTIL